MKTLLLTMGLFFVGAAALLSAQTPAYAGEPVRTTPKTSEDKGHNRLCLYETGTRIKRRVSRCGDYAGRSYSREDLRSTGAVDIDEALQRLDPSITRRRR